MEKSPFLHQGKFFFFFFPICVYPQRNGEGTLLLLVGGDLQAYIHWVGRFLSCRWRRAFLFPTCCPLIPWQAWLRHHWVMVDVLTLPSPPLTTPQRREAPHYCPVWVEEPTLHRVSIGLSLLTDRDENLSSLSDSTLGRVLALLQSLRASLLASPFSPCCLEYRWGQRFFRSLCLEQNHYFLQISCLAQQLLAWPFHWRADF